MTNVSSNQSIKENRVIFLDYLRIFAFVSVLIGHKFNSYLESISNNHLVHSSLRVIIKLLIPLFQNGGAGVVVFFLVSGYIITHVLQTENSVDFLIKRIFRIYPLYMVAVLFWYVPLAIVGHAESLLTLILQLMLVGDFFVTPYALSGVEWTLRIEIIFYLFMMVLRHLNLITNLKFNVFPYILVLTTLLLGCIAPIPTTDIFKGYFTIFAPFLFLGAIVYLFEQKKLGLTYFLFFIILVFYQYFNLIATYQKSQLDQHYAIIGFVIFISFWLFRTLLTAPSWILVISEMTYAVYLFHMWFFEYVKKGLAYLNILVLNLDIQALIILLLVCFFMVKYIEKPGVQLGKALLKNMHRKKYNRKIF